MDEQYNAQMARQEAGQTHMALGLFLGAFGLVLLVAVLFTETTPGKLINLVAAVILIGIGGAMMHTGRKQLKQRGER